MLSAEGLADYFLSTVIEGIYGPVEARELLTDQMDFFIQSDTLSYKDYANVIDRFDSAVEEFDWELCENLGLNGDEK